MKLAMGLFLLAPGDNPFDGAGGNGGGGSPAPAPAQAPVSNPTPSPTPASENRGSVNNPTTNSGERDFEMPDQSAAAGAATNQPARAPLTPADPNQAAGAAAGGAAPANFQSIRDAAREYGFQFGENVTDDRAALAQLVQLANANRQADYYAQLGQTIAPHGNEFRQFLEQRNNKNATPEGRKPWEAPPFDRRWEALVDQDARTGMFMSKPGVDPTIGRQVNEYVEWKQKFDENPAQVLNSMVQAQAREVAMQIYQEQSSADKERSEANAIVQRNSEWFYAKDQAGKPIFDFQGRRQASPAGAVYLKHLENVKRSGVRGASQQDALAMQLLHGEYAVMNMQRTAQTTQANGFPAQQATASPNTNPLAALAPQQQAITNGATPPGEEGLSLFERLQRNFAAAGVSDKDFENINFG